MLYSPENNVIFGFAMLNFKRININFNSTTQKIEAVSPGIDDPIKAITFGLSIIMNPK